MTYLLCYLVHLDAFGASDTFLLGVVGPWGEDEHAPLCNSIKEGSGRLVVFAEAVISDVDNRSLGADNPTLPVRVH